MVFSQIIANPEQDDLGQAKNDDIKDYSRHFSNRPG